jgi:hypothetical protein
VDNTCTGTCIGDTTLQWCCYDLYHYIQYCQDGSVYNQWDQVVDLGCQNLDDPDCATNVGNGSTNSPGRAGLSGSASPGTLHDLAKANGGRFTVEIQADGEPHYPGVTELAKASDVIAIGTPIGLQTRLTEDEKSITTDFQLRVQAVEKGNFMENAPHVLVHLRGGQYLFPDHTMAFVSVKDYRPVESGRVYIFFLRKSPEGDGFELTGGIQGQFEFDFGKGTVIPGDLTTSHAIVARYREMAIKSLLTEVHKGVKPLRVPGPSATGPR